MIIKNYVKINTCPEVYSPQEDTWFLTDVLVEQLRNIRFKESKMTIVCEIGIGTGFISIILGKKFPHLHFIGIDISPQASELSYLNLRNYLPRRQYDILCSDLLHALDSSKFFPNIIFFNPPYLITSKSESDKKKDFLAKSWCGGETGAHVIEAFLENLTNFSFKYAYFLSSKQNSNVIFEKRFQKHFEFNIIAEKKIEDEKLLCYLVQKCCKH